MSNLFLFGIMFCGGMAVAFQPSINARLAEKTGIVESACISFAVGTLALLIVSLTAGRGSLRGVLGASWWELTGGFLGALFVTLMILVIPRLGTAAAMAATISAQLIAGIALDHFGVLGIYQAPLDFKRFLGVALLLTGSGLILRR